MLNATVLMLTGWALAVIAVSQLVMVLVAFAYDENGVMRSFMLAALIFLVADLGFGLEGFRRWSAISFVIAAAIISLHLVLLVIMLAIERLKPKKEDSSLKRNDD